MTEIDLFEAAWAAVPAPLGAWRHDYKDEEWMAFANAVDDAVDHENGESLLLLDQDVSVSFREDVLIRFLGVNIGPQGCAYYGFLFTVPSKLEVMAWIEEDSILSRVPLERGQDQLRKAGSRLEEVPGRLAPVAS
ncbi:hypothetical protein [Phenylobacterium sp. J367]|uniref:hypothetical protein n=1 Tax=Phenylobacterium sp. J367 TaxID=2898435 RepID=UPI002151BE67|nr:hypothetical protein [Phenylobacterium sp. J367]MCR5878806.1 hypothetical protein [Phenylobacterium sp. J367]